MWRFRDFAQRILAQEKNSVSVPKEASISVALVYPNTYEVGISNLGFQTVYRLLNQIEDVRCERAFYYQHPFEDVASTLESGRRLGEFDIVAFSVSFELDYPNIVRILLNAGIPPLAEEREERHPLVIAGGVVTFLNPEPLAPFLDLFLVGEGEGLIEEFIAVYKECKIKRLTRRESLRAFSQIKGVYVPSLQPGEGVRRRYLKPALLPPTFSPIISPQGHFRETFLIEVGRGCGKGCRFCAASYVYHPFRPRTMENILQTIDRENVFDTKRVGLIGAALSDFKDLEQLCGKLTEKNYILGLSSLRINGLTERLIRSLEEGGVKTVTLAPEAGSKTLRRIIGKEFTDEQILYATELIARSQIENLKLYFMLGLPFEKSSDIRGIVDLVAKIQRIFLSGPRNRRIKVSINAFIPKPFTPFQWCPMAEERDIAQKRDFLHQELRKLKKVSVVRKSPRLEVFQGLLSLGNRSAGLVVLDMVRSGVSWKKACKTQRVDHQRIIHRERALSDPLPWDVLQGGVGKEKLWREFQQAKEVAAADGRGRL